jgi:hypothetical protein
MADSLKMVIIVVCFGEAGGFFYICTSSDKEE